MIERRLSPSGMPPMDTRARDEKVRFRFSGAEPYFIPFVFLTSLVPLLYMQAWHITGRLPIGPIQTLAVAGLVSLALERLLRRASFTISWPETHALLVFLGTSALSIPGSLWPRWATQTTLSLLKWLAIYLLIINTVTTLRRFRVLLWSTSLGGAVTALGTIQAYLQGATYEGRASWIGSLGNPNETAFALILLFPLVMAIREDSPKGTRFLLWGFVGIYLMGIFVTFSRGGMLALGAIWVLMVYRQRLAHLRIAMAALLVAGILILPIYWTRSEGISTDISTDTSAQNRLITLRAGMQMFATYPILGSGPGCSQFGWEAYGSPGMVHNVVIQALAESGLVGSSIYFFVLAVCLVHCRRIARLADHLRSPPLRTYAVGVELGIWGFLACGMTGPLLFLWYSYFLFGLVSALRKMALKELSRIEGG